MNECKKMFSRNVENLLLHCVVLSAYQLYDPGGNLFRRDFSVCKMIVSTFILAIHLQIITKPATSPSTLNDEAGGWRTLILREEYKFALTGCH